MTARSTACLLAVILGAPPLRAQAPAVEETLRLAGAYVERFITGFSNVVAEELYTQEAVRPRERRVLRSDLLLVRYPGATKWHVFRDVLEVDAKAVGDERAGQLAKLFLEPPDDALRRATEIARTGARHHLTNLDVYNNPLAVLSFLQPADQDQFRFTRAGLEKSLGPDVRTFGFQTTSAVARAREYAGRTTPRGRVWIDEKTGRVVKTELDAGGRQYPLRITTLFTTNGTLGIDVPAEMRYSFSGRSRDDKGVATYGNFRRFQVRTEVK